MNEGSPLSSRLACARSELARRVFDMLNNEVRFLLLLLFLLSLSLSVARSRVRSPPSRQKGTIWALSEVIILNLLLTDVC